MKVKSTYRAIFPVVITEKKYKANAEKLSGNIPLLLRKASSNKSSPIINRSEDKATIFCKKINFHQLTKRHYCIDIFPIFLSCANCQVVLVLGTILSEKENSSKIEKFIKKFGHASFETTEKFLKNVSMIK